MASSENKHFDALSIIKCTPEHATRITVLGAKTFWQSHGHSASKEDIASYVNRTFDIEHVTAELSEPTCQFFLLQKSGIDLGYSKLKMGTSIEAVETTALCKLERLYIDETVYDQGLGLRLFEHAKQEAVSQHQAGIWLYVWTENQRAVRFYQRQGFEEVGRYDFKISEKHSNPNYQMYLSLAPNG